MKNKYSFVVNMDIFPFDIYFSIGETDREFKTGIRKYLYPADYISLKKCDEEIWKLEECTNGRCYHNFDTGHTVIRVKEYKNAKNQGTLAHEIKHAVDYILWHHIGIKPKKNTEEVFAYAIGHVTTQVFTKIYGK